MIIFAGNQGRKAGDFDQSEMSNDRLFSPPDGSTLKWHSSSAQPQALSRQMRVSDKTGDHSKSDSSTSANDASNTQHRQSFATPLLMAPPEPSNSLEAVSAGLANIFGRTLHMLGFERCSLSQFLRVGCFLVKLTLLCRRCWPFMTTLQVGIPLVLLATLDLRKPRQTLLQTNHGWLSVLASSFKSPILSFLLFLVHLSVLSVASQWGALCVTRPSPRWDEWHRTLGN
jgi:hypothetical protein